MPRRPKTTNVRKHLQHINIILEGLKVYGYCPALETEVRQALLINRTILAISDKKRAQGNRHDICT